MRNVIALIAIVFFLSSCGLFKNTKIKNSDTEKVDVVIENKDDTKITTNTITNENATTDTNETEDNDYVIEFGVVPVGDTIVVVPKVIRGKQKKTIIKKEEISTAENKVEDVVLDKKEKIEISSKTKTSDKEKETSAFNFITIAIIFLIIVLLLKIFPVSFLRDKITSLISKKDNT